MSHRSGGYYASPVDYRHNPETSEQLTNAGKITELKTWGQGTNNNEISTPLASTCNVPKRRENALDLMKSHYCRRWSMSKATPACCDALVAAGAGSFDSLIPDQSRTTASKRQTIAPDGVLAVRILCCNTSSARDNAVRRKQLSSPVPRGESERG